MPQVHPTDFSIRSPHYRTLVSAGARFEKYMNTSCVMNYGKSRDQEISQARQLGLADLTPLPRTGFKGREAVQWGRSQDLDIGQRNNQAYLQQNGMLVARLADTEIVILNYLCSSSDQCAGLNERYTRNRPVKCYFVPRSNLSAWLMVTGQYSIEMFAKICGVDLRTKQFPPCAVAQTSIARINGIIIRNDLGETPAFHLLFDSASTEYMWSCLMDACTEFNGAPVGYAALLRL